MNILIVYYSRTGRTAKIAQKLAQELKADCEAIQDTKNREGVWGWLTAGSDGTGKKQTSIKQPKYDPQNYDLVIVGTPIWVNTTPAIRTYLTQRVNKFKQVAFFCTMGGSGGVKAFAEMSQLIKRKPIATLEILEDEVKTESYHQSLQQFLLELRIQPN